jgi:hypothetical protein
MGDSVLLAEEGATWPSALLSPALLASVFDRLSLDQVGAPLNAGTPCAWALTKSSAIQIFVVITMV